MTNGAIKCYRFGIQVAGGRSRPWQRQFWRHGGEGTARSGGARPDSDGVGHSGSIFGREEAWGGTSVEIGAAMVLLRDTRERESSWVRGRTGQREEEKRKQRGRGGEELGRRVASWLGAGGGGAEVAGSDWPVDMSGGAGRKMTTVSSARKFGEAPIYR